MTHHREICQKRKRMENGYERHHIVLSQMRLWWLSRSSPNNWVRKFGMAAAVKLYEVGRISSGAAAKLAGIPRTLFLTKLADYGVDTFRLTEQELQQEQRLV